MSSESLANLVASALYAHKRYGVSDAALAFRRRRGPDIITEPTEADWTEYRAALAQLDAALERLEAIPSVYVGAVELEPPTAQRKAGDYTETEDEWIQRVYGLIQDSGGQLPEDLGNALSVEEARALGIALESHRGWNRGGGYATGGITPITSDQEDQS